MSLHFAALELAVVSSQGLQAAIGQSLSRSLEVVPVRNRAPLPGALLGACPGSPLRELSDVRGA